MTHGPMAGAPASGEVNLQQLALPHANNAQLGVPAFPLKDSTLWGIDPLSGHQVYSIHV